MKTNNKGVTLIALVITIIVLLILAGVSIATLTGPNGLLNRAGQAQSSQEIGAINDKVTTTIAGIFMDGTVDSTKMPADIADWVGKIAQEYCDLYATAEGVKVGKIGTAEASQIVIRPEAGVAKKDNEFRVSIEANGQTVKIKEILEVVIPESDTGITFLTPTV